jgi:hypothetical protein
MTALEVYLPTMVVSYNLGVTRVKKTKTFVGSRLYDVLLITNVF